MIAFSNNRLIITLWVILTSLMASALVYKSASGGITFDANILNVLDLGDEMNDLTKAAAEPFKTKGLLLIQHQEHQESKTTLTKIAEQLLATGLVQTASSEPSKDFDVNELANIYSSYPLAFLSQAATKAKNNNDYSHIVDNYMGLMSAPSNPLVSLTINKAPLLNVADWFADKSSINRWQQDQGFTYIEHENKRYYPLFLNFNQAAIQLDTVVATIAQLDKLVAHYQTPNMEILSSGLMFHSAAITSQASFETQLFGGISIVGVLLLTLVSFRSIQPLICISLLLGSASLSGMLALTLVFDNIHILSLVFAVSLIGVAVDYGYHTLLTAKYTGFRNKQLRGYIAPAIFVSGGTTIISYLLLLLLPIPLLQQVAVFIVAGLAFTIITALTLIVHWPWQSKPETHPPIHELEFQPQGFKVILAGLILCCLAAAPTWFFQDNINAFNSSPAHLVNNEKRVSQIIGNQQYPRFIYTKGDNQQQILQHFEQIRLAINKINDEGFELLGIDQWVPSINTQQANIKWLQLGLAQGKLTPITDFMTTESVSNLNASSDSFMTIEQLPQAILKLYPAITAKEGNQVGILSYMGPIDPKFLQTLQQQLDFPVHYFDQPTKYSEALAKLREYLLLFLMLAAGALLLLMTLRYGYLQGLKLAVIPIVTALSSLALSHLLLGYVTLFNLLACILIIALAVDYVVFLIEHGKQQHVIKAISLSAATSGIAFGMFVFSSTPAILQFGLTILIGVIIAWSLCFTLPTTILKRNQ
ncbi:hypothetical protein [Paraglaciecola marina]|uniref:hypothetical protein n=1 Tax=Paraglaciecola marina TaxID=2500157 RepID=UPI00105EF6CF|nr:hypothetical protein [Paraglaciecola marina]